MSTFREFMEQRYLGDTFARYREETWDQETLDRVISDELTERHWAIMDADGPEPSEYEFDESKKGRRWYKIWDAIEKRKDPHLYEFNQVALANIWVCDPP